VRLNDTAVSLSWTLGADNDAVYLLLSTSSRTLPGTGLPERVHRKVDVSTVATIVVSELQPNTTYYAYLLGEGCGGQKRALSDAGAFVL
jgi:hypothetical protein